METYTDPLTGNSTSTPSPNTNSDAGLSTAPGVSLLTTLQGLGTTFGTVWTAVAGKPATPTTKATPATSASTKTLMIIGAIVVVVIVVGLLLFRRGK